MDIAVGRAPGRERDEAIDEHSLFELGSITKVMTAVLLADMVNAGGATFDTTLGEVFGLRHNAHITLEELATHTAGLPPVPANIRPLAERAPQNPYSTYSAEHLIEALESEQPSRSSAPSYSNYGFMALGEALSRLAGAPLDVVLTDRVLRPLGMLDTVLTCTRADEPRRAVPHEDGKPVPCWTALLPGAGGFEGPVGDVCAFVRACLDSPRGIGPLADAITVTLRRRDRSSEFLAWQPYGPEVRWHNGGTGGSTTFFGLRLSLGEGVVILTNGDDPREQVTGHGLVALGIDQPLFG